ncbi:hypothetical protein [Nostoc sp. LPT]|uniref:hypothetical protein n=1 Tax=Nostoc sp. LPT TaxID=2815387 RepID=UPI001DA9650A|nr:hypothetical protein [Nostoc sp. LPT]MBN4006889.1 hypothetical protein [Nostoc sp. LPT]
MTDTPFPSRIDRIEEILLGVAQRQAETQEQLNELANNVDRVLSRSAILDDVLLELRDSHEQHQRNFEEHQRTTNAALQSLESILLQLIRNKAT